MFETENFKTLQYNITHMLYINSSNIFFFSRHDFKGKTLLFNL